jgi:putative tricarboxylic transport membrane protein
VNNSSFDMWVMLALGIFGYAMRKLRFDLGPLLLAFVLGPIMEKSVRQSLLMSEGSGRIFVERPISAGLLLFAAAFLLLGSWTARRKRRSLAAAAAAVQADSDVRSERATR